MAETFSIILTTLGLAEVAAAIATEVPVVLVDFSVGDSNGAYYEPSEGQITLVNEQYRSTLTSIGQDVSNANWVVVQGTIPADGVGGWYVREVGIWSQSGNLFAIGKYPETFKPLLSSGAGKDLVIKGIMEVTNTTAITLVVDPNVTIATVSYVENFANYIKDGFGDFVVVSDPANPEGDSGDNKNPYNLDMTELKPSGPIERVFTYAMGVDEKDNAITNDVRGRSDTVNSDWKLIRASRWAELSGKKWLMQQEDGYFYITFYGTGLNLLMWTSSEEQEFKFWLDGDAPITRTYDYSGQVVMDANDYMFLVSPLVSDLTLETHTIRIQPTSGHVQGNLYITGFDILGDVDSVVVPTGIYYINGKKYTNLVGADLTPTAIGANNGRRDRLVIGEDLVIQLIQGVLVDTPKYYGDSGFDTQRLKEEVKRIYYVDEFIRTDVLRKTLIDGATSMISGVLITEDYSTGIVRNYQGADSSINFDVHLLDADVGLYINFYGTGCDISLRFSTETPGIQDVYLEIKIDGQGSGVVFTESDIEETSAFKTYKVCTGLSYGSHRVKIDFRGTGGNDPSHSWVGGIDSFTVYHPKTPDLPANHLDLGCLNITPTDGWVLHAPDREVIYSGVSWANSIASPPWNPEFRIFGFEINTLIGSGAQVSDFSKFTFTGTGIIWISERGNEEAISEIYLDDELLTTSHTDWGTITVTSDAPDWNTGTGRVDCYGAGAPINSEISEAIKIVGLSAGQHTIKIVTISKNGSSAGYQQSVHAFKVLPLSFTLDNEDNINKVLNNIVRKTTPITENKEMIKLLEHKQDKSLAAAVLEDESIIEKGIAVHVIDDVSETPYGTANPIVYSTVFFRTRKLGTPVIIIVPDDTLIGGIAMDTMALETDRAYTEGFVMKTSAGTNGELPDLEAFWTAISQ